MSDYTKTTQQQREWLDKLQGISRKPILVKAIEGATPEDASDTESMLYRWNYYKDIWNRTRQPIYTRRILDNELLFDPDVKDWSVLYHEFSKIVNQCRIDNIPYQLSYSGGNGAHLSIFFSDLDLDAELFNGAKTLDIDLLKIVRQTLLKTILDRSQVSKDIIKLDSKKINFSKNRLGSQVREYGTLRQNGNFKTLIDDIPATRPEPGSLPLRFPEKIEIWDISGYKNDIEHAIRAEIEKATSNNEYNINDLDFTDTKINQFPCIKLLLDKGRDSQRYYGAVSIALMAKKCKYTWDAIEKTIEKFLNKCDGLTKDDIKLRLNNVKPLFEQAYTGTGGYHFSCKELKETFGIGYCDYGNCPIRDKKYRAEKDSAQDDNEPAREDIKKAALEIAEHGDPLGFILDTHQKIHVGDVETAKILVCSIGSQSVINSDGIQPKGSGDSGKGKTHCFRAMLHLVPNKWKVETTLSDKAIFYMKIQKGAVIFSDDTVLSEALEGVIKRASSNFQKGDTHTTVDANREVKTLTIPQRIVWWLTSVDDSQSSQLLNRQVCVEVDDSPDQDIEVMKFQYTLAKEGTEKYPETTDVLICREIIRDIKEHVHRVKIPYVDAMTWNNPENRRNLDIFFDIVRSFAATRHRQRHKDQDGFLIAHIKDYEDAEQLYRQRATSQTTKLNKTEIAIIQHLKDQYEASAETLQRAGKISSGRLTQIMKGKDGKTGLLEKVKGLVCLKVADKEDEEEDSRRIYYKNIYRLENFSFWDNYESVVSIDPSKLNNLPFYQQFTHVLPQKVNHEIVNSIINNNNKYNQFTDTEREHSTNISVGSGDKENENFSHMLSKVGKIGKTVNRASADNGLTLYQAGKSSGKSSKQVKRGVKSSMGNDGNNGDHPQAELVAHIRQELYSQASYFPEGVNEHLIIGQAYKLKTTDGRIKEAIDRLIQKSDIRIISTDEKGIRRIKWAGV